MNIWDQIKAIPGGVVNLKDWLGDGGQVVDPKTAQARANVCITCGLNKPGLSVTTAVALAVRAHLGVKNKLKLRVDGEKSLNSCQACGCVLRLLIWETQERVELGITEEERAKLPGMCWKISNK